VRLRVPAGATVDRDEQLTTMAAGRREERGRNPGGAGADVIRVTAVKSPGGSVEDPLSRSLAHEPTSPVHEQRARRAVGDAAEHGGLGGSCQYGLSEPAALADEAEHEVEAVMVEVLDVQTGGFADASPVEGEHAQQAVGGRAQGLLRGQQIMDLAPGEHAWYGSPRRVEPTPSRYGERS
jgi:hypothetical protein